MNRNKIIIGTYQRKHKKKQEWLKLMYKYYEWVQNPFLVFSVSQPTQEQW